MARAICSILLLAVLLWGCTAPPRQELLTARTALAKAETAEAQALAPEEYRAASAALRDGEELIRRKKYRLARQILPLAESHAQKALIKAREEQVQRQLRKTRAQEEQLAHDTTAAAEAAEEVIVRPPQKELAPPPPAIRAPKVLAKSYQVRGGETLWTIAARKDIYADALLWPLIYQANRDQIKDPRQIYPEQTLTIPRRTSDEDKQIAREKARKSKVFPIDQLVH